MMDKTYDGSGLSGNHLGAANSDSLAGRALVDCKKVSFLLQSYRSIKNSPVLVTMSCSVTAPARAVTTLALVV